MKKLWKKILVALLGFSNLAVLGVVFHIYFDSHQSMLLFSTSEDQNDLEEKIQTECSKFSKEFVEGKRSSFICNAKVSQKDKGASYSLRTRFKVKKSDLGCEIEGQGRISNPTQHATEAHFCNGCTRTDQVKENKCKDIMYQILTMAATIYSEAQTSVRKAHEEHSKKDRERRMADLKERHCEGAWNEDKEKFEEFDTEERLACKMEKISSLDLPLEIEEFYHKKLKNELWKTALSENDDILSDLMDKFKNPYRYTFSVRASAGLIKNYLDWKDDFEILDSIKQKENFVRAVKRDVDQMISLMSKEQSQKDFYYLNQGFDGLLAKLNQATASMPRLTEPSSSNPPPVNYEDVRKQVKDLY